MISTFLGLSKRVGSSRRIFKKSCTWSSSIGLKQRWFKDSLRAKWYANKVKKDWEVLENKHRKHIEASMHQKELRGCYPIFPLEMAKILQT